MKYCLIGLMTISKAKLRNKIFASYIALCMKPKYCSLGLLMAIEIRMQLLRAFAFCTQVFQKIPLHFILL